MIFDFRDLFKALGFAEAPLVPTALLVISYGSVGIFVFFAKKAPLCMHQFYVICNCSLVSVFYLRMFPTHTAWFVLACIIVWGMFFGLHYLYYLNICTVASIFVVSVPQLSPEGGKPADQLLLNDFSIIKSTFTIGYTELSYYRQGFNTALKNKCLRASLDIH